MHKKSFQSSIELVYPSNENEVKKFHHLTYFGKPSRKFKSVLTKGDNNMAFQTNNSLGKGIKTKN